MQLKKKKDALGEFSLYKLYEKGYKSVKGEPVGTVGGVQDLEILQEHSLSQRALDPAWESMRDQCPAAEPLLLTSFRATAEVD